MSCRKLPALTFLILYTATIAWYFVRHVEGDPGRSAFAYFWTWDMYPHYEAESVRRLVLGRTERGTYVQLLPTPRDRFRWGNHDQATRYDLDRRELHLKTTTAAAVNRYGVAPSHGSLREVLVIDRYWPVRFNLADDLYRETYGKANPRREYFRVVAEADVSAAGGLEWHSP